MKQETPPIWKPTWNKQNFFEPIDFFARRIHYIDHIVPIWEHIPLTMRGNFYVPDNLKNYTEERTSGKVIGVKPYTSGGQSHKIVPEGEGPLLICAYADLRAAYGKNPKRPFILMEHGVGLSFPEHTPAYGGGDGYRAYVNLFLAPNTNIYTKTAKTYPNAKQVIIGTPKLDKWINYVPSPISNPPVVAISFHWDGKCVCPEAGNALEHYRKVLPILSKHFHVIGHGHPRIINELIPIYHKYGFEIIQDFEEVQRRVDVYVNDSSSTIYEFLVTGKPIVILNAPWFRKSASYGIRFWDYTDIGPQCEAPEDLISCIKKGLLSGNEYAPFREKAIKDLYPYWGTSSERAGEAIVSFVRGVQLKRVL
ncbi:MAG: CDP-glycerol glycerophosphotransferase family protein, partial [Ignavibacteria bacterium]|nr:CDP-glycerol glycerophosphotransferase family protein [Ignavibacteria bacterium]